MARYKFNELEYYSNPEAFTEYKTSIKDVKVFCNTDTLVAAFFTGRKTKANWKHKFKSVPHMMEYIEKKLKEKYDSNKAKENKKASDKVMAVENRAKIQIGQIFHTHWGYENTYVDFFEVIGRKSDSKVIVREIHKEKTDSGFMSGTVRAIPGVYIGSPKVVTINKYGNLTKVDKYGHPGYIGEADRDYHVSWGY